MNTWPEEYGHLETIRIAQLHGESDEHVELEFEHVTLSFDGRAAAQIARAVRVVIQQHHASIERFPVTMKWTETNE